MERILRNDKEKEFEKIENISNIVNEKIIESENKKIDIPRENIFKVINIVNKLSDKSFSNHTEEKHCLCKKCLIIRISQDMSQVSFE